MSKGSQRRPSFISRQEEGLRWDLAMGYITRADFDRRYKELEKRGLITRGKRRR